MFEIFANLVLAIFFKKVIATEQKLPNVSTANGTIDALEREPLARAFSWLLLYFCNFNFEAWKMWLVIYINIIFTFRLVFSIIGISTHCEIFYNLLLIDKGGINLSILPKLFSSSA